MLSLEVAPLPVTDVDRALAFLHGAGRLNEGEQEVPKLMAFPPEVQRMRRRVLLVEDDRDLGRLVMLQLEELGCECRQIKDAEKALAEARSNRYDLVIFDISLPLDAPSARTKEVLRRAYQAEAASRARACWSQRIDVAGISIDLERRQAKLEGQRLALTATEFDLLACFARSPGRVFTRAQLLDQVWGYYHAGYERAVNTHISRLRNKIERDPANPHFIQTVWGFGYRFSDPEE